MGTKSLPLLRVFVVHFSKVFPGCLWIELCNRMCFPTVLWLVLCWYCVELNGITNYRCSWNVEVQSPGFALIRASWLLVDWTMQSDVCSDGFVIGSVLVCVELNWHCDVHVCLGCRSPFHGLRSFLSLLIYLNWVMASDVVYEVLWRMTFVVSIEVNGTASYRYSWNLEVELL